MLKETVIDDPNANPPLHSEERTCSIMLNEEGSYVVVEHVPSPRDGKFAFARQALGSSADPDGARGIADLLGLRVVEFSRHVVLVNTSGDTNLIVRTRMPDGHRMSALSLRVHFNRHGELWPGPLHFHLEDATGAPCEVLGAHCDRSCGRNHPHISLGAEVFAAHGDSRIVAQQLEISWHSPEILWHALAGILVRWTQHRSGQRSEEASKISVRSIADLLEKYGPTGIGRLIERTAALLPDDLEGEDDLIVELCTAIVDLELALRDAARRG